MALKELENVSPEDCLYRRFGRYFAQTPQGLEEIAGKELTRLGADSIQEGYRGVYFNASQESLYKINYGSRLISRVLAPLITFDCHSEKYLYKRARSLAWEEWLPRGRTFAVFASVNSSRIKHSQYASLCVKDAIVDALREKTGHRPDVNPRQPDLWINLHVEGNKATLSADASGGPLHKRGYRKSSVTSPMQEILAAAILHFTGWTGERPLMDFMCGSGTLLCEAHMAVCRIPAGYLRPRFGFQSFPDFDANLWKMVRQSMNRQIVPVKGLVSGSDIDRTSVKAAWQNLSLLPGGKEVPVSKKDFRELESLENYTLVSNPPYGIRMRKGDDLALFYKKLGDFLKQKCRGSEAYLYFGDRKWIKSVGLKPSFKRPLKNGGLDGRLVKYELY